MTENGSGIVVVLVGTAADVLVGAAKMLVEVGLDDPDPESEREMLVNSDQFSF